MNFYNAIYVKNVINMLQERSMLFFASFRIYFFVLLCEVKSICMIYNV